MRVPAHEFVSRLILLFPLMLLCAYAGEKTSLPAFGRDTVLVWRSENQGLVSDFVARIAEFLPDRFIEWEDATTQGTILMTSRAVMAGRRFVNASLFKAGGDAKGEDATTLWLSQKTYRDLKQKKHLKLIIDSIEGEITNEGEAEITVEVNGVPTALPVIRVRDERGSERWFLDREDNPLLAKHMVRKYTQTLVSISTDRANALRWIKGKKLPDSR